MYAVSVVIVTDQSREHIARCLRSVCSQEGVSFNVVLWDNASTDDTCKVIEKSLLPPFPNTTLIRHGEKLSSEAAVELAKLSARANYLCLLKPDAIFKKPQDLARLLARAEKTSQTLVRNDYAAKVSCFERLVAFFKK